MVAQKFKTLSKRTVCGTALVTFSDTNQGFIVTQMTDQEDNIILGKIVFDDNNQERKS